MKKYNILVRFVINLVQTCAKIYLLNEQLEHTEVITVPITHSIINWRSDLTEILRFFFFDHIELSN